MTRLTAIAFISILMITVCLLSFAQAQQREFEVATVKPTRIPGGVRGACHGIDSKFGPNDSAASVPLGRCVVSAGRLSHMIGIAYGVSMDMLAGGPDWVAGGN